MGQPKALSETFWSFPRTSSFFVLVMLLAFLGSPLFSTNQAKLFFLAGVPVPAKFWKQNYWLFH